MPLQMIDPIQVTSTGIVMTRRSKASRRRDASFEAWPDDGTGRHLRASTRKPGLLAVLGFQVPARPMWIGGILILGAITLLSWDAFRQPSTLNDAPLSTMQSVTINSRPEGAIVSVDGMTRGTTPLKLSLPVGKHVLKLQKGEDGRTIQISVEPGAALSQLVDLAPEQGAGPAGP